MLRRVALSAAVMAVGVGMSGCGTQRPVTTDSPSRGTIRARRDGRTVIVQVGIENLPAQTQVLTVGLKLKDDSPVYPRTIRWLEGPGDDLAGTETLAFEFNGSGEPGTPPADAVRPDRWLRVSFDLDNGLDHVDGGAFSMVLGDPDMAEGCHLGMTATIASSDGSPSLYSCLTPATPFGDDSLPLPPAPVCEASKASFRLAERQTPHEVNVVPRQVAWSSVFGPPQVALMPAYGVRRP